MLILTRDEAIGRLNKLLVAPATGRIRDIPTKVEVGREDGMPQECAISLDNTSLVRKSFLTERITALDHEKIDQVCRALGRATSCG